ncbi:MAG: hypothetical protein ACYC63_12470 [Armatimonadota bacterium]
MVDRTEMEIQAKLQVRIGKALLRTKLIMIGNGLLVAWAASLVLLLIWYFAYMYVGTSYMERMVCAPFGLTVLQLHKLNIMAMTVWKLASYLLLLCPGIGFRVAGEAMKV